MAARTSHVGLILLGLVASAQKLHPQSSGDTALFVREISIVGNETTKEHVILREMSLKVGDALTPEILEHDRKRIEDLRLFNRVDIDYAPEGNQAHVIVSVHERWYIFPYPVLGFKYRNLKNLYYGVGLSHQNFRGRNEKVGFEAALGYDRWAQVYYANPRLNDDDLSLRSWLSMSRMRNLSVAHGEYEQEQFSASTTLGKRFGLYQAAQVSAGYEVWVVRDSVIGRTASADGR
ncbi:MAG: POTRA domain-containing protein, partial [Bacteroidota bacterium]